MAKPGSTETTREMAQDGADITTPATMPSGGWGIRGWLSALFTAFKDSLDSTTDAVATIEYEHNEIHAGSSFSVHVDNTTLNSDDDRTLLGFECPDTAKWFHMILFAAASSAAEVFLYEDVTIDDDEGTEVAALNRNRNSILTSTMLSLENPAVAGLATWMTEAQVNTANFSSVTTIAHAQLVIGEGKKAVGGKNRASQEWILKQGKKYAVVIQNIGASVNLHEIELDFYEHTNH